MTAFLTQIKRMWGSLRNLSRSLVEKLLNGASAAGKTVVSGLAMGGAGVVVIFCMAIIGTATVFDYLSPQSKEVEKTSSPEVPPVPPVTGKEVPKA